MLGSKQKKCKNKKHKAILDNCDFHDDYKDSQGRHVCKRCHTPTPFAITKWPAHKIRRGCPKSVGRPSLLKLITTFLKEFKIWVLHGCPLRPSDLIKHLYYDHCKKCMFFEPGKYTESGACKACGCRLSPRNDGMNKIAWGTTSCPKIQPDWIQLPGYQHLGCCGKKN